MIDAQPFVHLHCHTHYSLLDGANRIPDLVNAVKERGMNAVAVTDHGNLFGAVEFYNRCRQHDVNPIIGYEAYVAPGRRTDRNRHGLREAGYHLTLLSMNRTGFRNLVKLSSAAYLEGFYYKPRIDKELLEAHNDGLICLSGCAASELSNLVLGERMDEAKNLVAWYVDVFGDRFYLEIQNAGLEIQKQCAEGTVDLAREMGLPLVATNDAHYLNQEDAAAHDVLLCVNTRTLHSDEKRMRMEGDQFFVRTPQQMYEAFPQHRDAVARTQEIADRVHLDLDLTTRHFPVFRPPQSSASGRGYGNVNQALPLAGGWLSEGELQTGAPPPQPSPTSGEAATMTDAQYLRQLCDEGLTSRYGEHVNDEHRRRLDDELNIIEQMGYSSYFLIVWDFVRFAAENDIPCRARGSACGSLVAYLLGLSCIDPLKYDLLFERFLDPNRTEPPDIDIDFCRDGRQKVIDYTKEKYGEANVAQIGTFGTLKAKAVIRDVGRVLAVPLARVDEIAKMVPDTLNIKLAEALEQSPELKEAYDQDPQVRDVIDVGQRLEGLARSAGTHAAGVVVADRPLVEYVPLQTITGKDDVVTQWDGHGVEQAGLLKMDFLGLRNLTILDKAVQNVKKHRGLDLDPDALLSGDRLHDRKTFELLQRGETKGIFQLESGGMRDLLKKMQPDRFEDIIATSALYRPGPLEGGMVMTYVEVKHGRQPVPKAHPVVDDILAETYGVMVYQEQVMRILNRVGGIELSSAYRCIKAISKKKLPIIAKFREQFVEGAQQNGLTKAKAVELFAMIEKFAGYGFNKSHSTAYAAIAYQTAYLKAHYPHEFMAALLSCGMENSDRIAEHVDDCRRMEIPVLPPDVNHSDVEFGVDGDKLTFGLAAIKGVGEQAVSAIVQEREAHGPYRNIFDLSERVGPKALTKATLEILIKAGALDSFGPNRAQHLLVAERAVQAAAALHRDQQRGQKNLFGETEADSAESASPSLPEAPDWTHRQKLTFEKEVLGFYLTSHPLTEYGDRLVKLATHTISDIAMLDDNSEVVLGGMISSIKRAGTKKPTRNGHTRYVNFDFEDLRGVVRCILWPDDYARFGEAVQPEAVCFVKGRVERRGREPNVIVRRLLSLEEAEKELTEQLAIKFQRGLHTEQDMRQVRDVLRRFPGRTQVVVIVDTADEAKPTRRLQYTLKTPDELQVSCTAELRAELDRILGEEHFRFYAVSQKNGRRKRSPAPAVA